MSKKLGSEQAFPMTDGMSNWENGMSKRLYLASTVLQGILSNKEASPVNIGSNVECAYKYADELLKQE